MSRYSRGGETDTALINEPGDLVKCGGHLYHHIPQVFAHASRYKVPARMDIANPLTEVS